MPKSVFEYIERQKDRKLVQVYIPMDIVNALMPHVEKQNVSWPRLIIACLENLRDSLPERKKR